MDTKELPAHPSLEQYKKQAKDLVKSSKSGRREALQVTLQRIKKDHPRFGRLADLELQGTKLALADAQLVIAREHGFESWPRFAKHIEGLTRQNSPVSRFESAVDAVVTGDVAKLNELLGEDPKLVRERSTFLHHATLLHYVDANGVENYRQKTPKNACKIQGIRCLVSTDLCPIHMAITKGLDEMEPKVHGRTHSEVPVHPASMTFEVRHPSITSLSSRRW